MKINSLLEVTRKENFIYYRREFHAKAVYELPEGMRTGRIEFTIETEPTGKKDISVKLVDQMEYPLLPLLQALKEYIKYFDRDGQLP